MGGKASQRKAPPKKKRPPLDTVFSCPFCNHEKSIKIKLDRERKVGDLKCEMCAEKWQTPIHALSAPIDVYTEWIDQCDVVNEA